MPRTTRTITTSVSPEMEAQIEEVMRQEGRTRSELLREALRRYIEERQWNALVQKNEKHARALGISPDDVERLVDEYRAEKRSRS